jgi:translation initiation factor IF-3
VYNYQKQKKEKSIKKSQKIAPSKEVRMRPVTEEHDFQVKLRKIKEFIENSSKVKVTVRFKGREIAHKDIGEDLLNRVIEETTDIATSDNAPMTQGRIAHIFLSPKSKK